MTREQYKRSKLLKSDVNVLQYVDGVPKQEVTPHVTGGYQLADIPPKEMQRYVVIKHDGRKYQRPVKGIDNTKYFKYRGEHYAITGELISL